MDFIKYNFSLDFDKYNFEENGEYDFWLGFSAHSSGRGICIETSIHYPSNTAFIIFNMLQLTHKEREKLYRVFIRYYED